VTDGFAAIIPAAGLGTRLAVPGSEMDAPKALRRLSGRTILQRSVDVLAKHLDEIVIAVPGHLVDAVHIHEPGMRVAVVAGGDTRAGPL
jgi:2-C-methyl-D-erythritol 4-phosphate cytidylyltransferase